MREMKRNVSVVRFKFLCNIHISGKIIKEMPGSVAIGTHCTCCIVLTYQGSVLEIMRIICSRELQTAMIQEGSA